MLVQAAAASCWVVGSSGAAAVPPSLSARRESERASRRSAVIALADGGSGLSTSLSAMPLILRCTTTDSRPIEPRHQCRKWNPEHVAAKAEGHPSAVLGVDGSEWPVAGRLANTATKPLNLSRDRQEQLRRLAATGEPVRELATAFGIGRATAYGYLAGGRSGQTGT